MRTLPADRNAAVPTAFAATNGLRDGRTYTLVMNSSVFVTAAMAPTDTHGSGHNSSSVYIGRPSEVYG